MRKILIVVGIAIVLVGVVAFLYYKPSSEPTLLEGEENLEVKVLRPYGSPVEGIEVDLWTAENPSGPPTAGYAFTNAEGVASFEIPAGQYTIGFNSVNFPSGFIFPERTEASVIEGILNQKTITLEATS
jgi:hypothetical protein